MTRDPFARRGISIAPGDARGWSNRAAACLAMKNPSGALSDATRAVAIEPEWAKARYFHTILSPRKKLHLRLTRSSAGQGSRRRGERRARQTRRRPARVQGGGETRPDQRLVRGVAGVSGNSRKGRRSNRPRLVSDPEPAPEPPPRTFPDASPSTAAETRTTHGPTVSIASGRRRRRAASRVERSAGRVRRIRRGV